MLQPAEGPETQSLPELAFRRHGSYETDHAT